MGLKGIQQFDTTAFSLPYHAINCQLANRVYLIVHDQSGSKTAHMSVLFDLAGQSTDDTLSGILIHMVANHEDGNIPHQTSFSFHEWKGAKSELSFFWIGSFINSKYLQGGIALPSFIINDLCVSKLCSNFFYAFF